MNETTVHPLIKAQLEREDDQVSLGIDRYYKHVGKVQATDTGPGLSLAYRAITVTSEAIDRLIQDTADGKAGAGRPSAVVPYLATIESVPAAYITARCVINGMADGHRVQHTAMQIAAQIEEHLQFDTLAEEAPGLEHTMRTKAEKWTTGSARRFIMRLGARIAGVRGLEWKQGDKLRLGMKLIELFVTETGFVELSLITAGKNNRATVMRPTEQTREWLEDEHSRQAVSAPAWRPMLVQPDPWTGLRSGGYLSKENQLAFIGGTGREYHQDVEHIDMPEVYAAVNRVQDTPWRVNTAVLDVLAAVWKTGGTIGGLPTADDLPLPERPADIPSNVPLKELSEEHQARINAYRSEKRKAAEANAALISKRLSLATQISMASENREHGAIYFPHNLDFRGRMYSVVTGLNPQGDDTAKALIEFAEGKPLGKSGAYWLSVHIANLFGVDKVSFDERVAWVVENGHLLLDSAANPLDGDRFWCEADYPYCALAACFEYAGMLVEGESHVSHLPIAMDGTCSGLQHFSAMLRDEHGGAAVNLINSDKPSDIYTQVALRTEELLAASGDPEVNPWIGNVSRKIVKRPCMTFAYSVTSRGMRDQIVDECRKQADGCDYLPGVDNFDAGRVLAPYVETAIKDTVSRASEAMDWLKDTTSAYFTQMIKHMPKEGSEKSIPINWNTPDGFPAQQRYAKYNGKRFKVWFNGNRMDIQLRVATQRPDTRKQASGIAPNFIHSMDACHLRAVVNSMYSSGVTDAFAMIHDSFGVHACDVDELHASIRSEFIELYTDSRLEDFLSCVSSVTPDADFPPLPAVGGLDLEEVRDADFFFS